jgi:hypothetical protein
MNTQDRYHASGMPRLTAACTPARIGIATLLAGAALPNIANAQTTKTFIDYFQPTPITCPLATNAWGCTATGATPSNCVAGTGVVPRDTCNGMESPSNPPGHYYWDGKVIRAADGTWHLFADRWPGTSGFGAWTSSDPIHAAGDGGALGPFTDNALLRSHPFRKRCEHLSQQTKGTRWSGPASYSRTESSLT